MAHRTFGIEFFLFQLICKLFNPKHVIPSYSISKKLPPGITHNHIIHASGKVRIDRIDQTGILNSETKSHTHKLRVIKKIRSVKVKSLLWFRPT